MAFKAVGKIGSAYGGPIKIARVLANSITVTELDSVKFTSGFVALGTAGASVAGHVTAIRTEKGVGVETNGTAGAQTGSFAGTFLTASNNQTVAKVKAEIDISKETLYAASLNNTIGTTTGSNLDGYHIDLIDEDELDEDTAATTAAQYSIHGVDVTDPSKAAVTIFESVIFGPLSA